ncbi:hypothetical protein ACWCQZ_43710 [Streptomyces sp. NPDC002285]
MNANYPALETYYAGKDEPEGTPAHCLYVWIEYLHELMDRLCDRFTAGGWEHDFSIDSLQVLERDLGTRCGAGDGTDEAAMVMESVAGYFGEVLLRAGGGRWVWQECAGAGGLPAVQPDPALGLEPIVPMLLVGQAVYEKTGNIFTTVALRLRKAVVDHAAAHPGWTPERVRTPWVRRHELDAYDDGWRRWPDACLYHYRTWWADRAGGGVERWNFQADSLDALEKLLRQRLGTVAKYDKVVGRDFWTMTAWYIGEYVVRHKGASWQYRTSNPQAPPGTWYGKDSYWTDSAFVGQPFRYDGHSEHPADMVRDVLMGASLREIVDRFPCALDRPGRADPASPGRGDAAEPWPEALWPLVAPEHLPPPLMPRQVEELDEEARQLKADSDLRPRYEVKPGRVTYTGMAEVLVDLGMITQEKARGVLHDFRDYAHDTLDDSHDIADTLEEFGVAVSIHADDVDYADEHYAWLLDRAAALTGGKVTVTNYRFVFDKDDEDDRDNKDGEDGEYEEYQEEDGRGTLYFDRNGEELSFCIEQESNDYLDMGAAQAAIEALSPDDDPRSFRCVDNGPRKPPGTTDDIMVLATADQRAGLRRHFGIEFHEPW